MVLNNYCVYCHTNKTNGKKYVGITRQKPEYRWGKNGKRYNYPATGRHPYSQNIFYKAIKKYGWDNFTHEVVYTHLTREEACDIEIKLIAEWHTSVYEHGYNVSPGGDNNIVGESTRKILREMHSQPINQYDSEGYLVNSYKNAEEASAVAGCRPDVLRHHTSNGELYYSNGSYWIRSNAFNELFVDVSTCVNKPKPPKEHVVKKRGRPTKAFGKYTLDGKLICTYESFRQCKEAEGYRPAFDSNCHGFMYKKTTVDKVEPYTVKAIVPSKPVYQLDYDGNILAFYPSLNDAIRKTGIKQIRKVIYGNQKHAGGYGWKLAG